MDQQTHEAADTIGLLSGGYEAQTVTGEELWGGHGWGLCQECLVQLHI